MSGKVEGGIKAAVTNKKRYGEDFYKRIGSMGGKKPTDMPKGFSAMSPERRRELGRIGGKKSRKVLA